MAQLTPEEKFQLLKEENEKRRKKREDEERRKREEEELKIKQALERKKQERLQEDERMRNPSKQPPPPKKQILHKGAKKQPVKVEVKASTPKQPEVDKQRQQWREGLKQHIAQQRAVAKQPVLQDPATAGKVPLTWQELKVAAEAGFDELLRHQELEADMHQEEEFNRFRKRSPYRGAVKAAAASEPVQVILLPSIPSPTSPSPLPQPASSKFQDAPAVPTQLSVSPYQPAPLPHSQHSNGYSPAGAGAAGSSYPEVDGSYHAATVVDDSSSNAAASSYSPHQVDTGSGSMAVPGGRSSNWDAAGSSNSPRQPDVSSTWHADGSSNSAEQPDGSYSTAADSHVSQDAEGVGLRRGVTAVPRYRPAPQGAVDFDTPGIAQTGTGTDVPSMQSKDVTATATSHALHTPATGLSASFELVRLASPPHDMSTGSPHTNQIMHSASTHALDQAPQPMTAQTPSFAPHTRGEAPTLAQHPIQTEASPSHSSSHNPPGHPPPALPDKPPAHNQPVYAPLPPSFPPPLPQSPSHSLTPHPNPSASTKPSTHAPAQPSNPSIPDAATHPPTHAATPPSTPPPMHAILPPSIPSQVPQPPFHPLPTSSSYTVATQPPTPPSMRAPVPQPPSQLTPSVPTGTTQHPSHAAASASDLATQPPIHPSMPAASNHTSQPHKNFSMPPVATQPPIHATLPPAHGGYMHQLPIPPSIPLHTPQTPPHAPTPPANPSAAPQSPMHVPTPPTAPSSARAASPNAQHRQLQLATSPFYPPSYTPTPPALQSNDSAQPCSTAAQQPINVTQELGSMGDQAALDGSQKPDLTTQTNSNHQVTDASTSFNNPPSPRIPAILHTTPAPHSSSSSQQTPSTYFVPPSWQSSVSSPQQEQQSQGDAFVASEPKDDIPPSSLSAKTSLSSSITLLASGNQLMTSSIRSAPRVSSHGSSTVGDSAASFDFGSRPTPHTTTSGTANHVPSHSPEPNASKTQQHSFVLSTQSQLEASTQQTASSTLQAASSMQHAASSASHPASSIQQGASSTPQPASSVHQTASSLPHQGSSTQAASSAPQPVKLQPFSPTPKPVPSPPAVNTMQRLQPAAHGYLQEDECDTGVFEEEEVLDEPSRPTVPDVQPPHPNLSPRTQPSQQSVQPSDPGIGEGINNLLQEIQQLSALRRALKAEFESLGHGEAMANMGTLSDFIQISNGLPAAVPVATATHAAAAASAATAKHAVLETGGQTFGSHQQDQGNGQGLVQNSNNNMSARNAPSPLLQWNIPSLHSQHSSAQTAQASAIQSATANTPSTAATAAATANTAAVNSVAKATASGPAASIAETTSTTANHPAATASPMDGSMSDKAAAVLEAVRKLQEQQPQQGGIKSSAAPPPKQAPLQWVVPPQQPQPAVPPVQQAQTAQGSKAIQSSTIAQASQPSRETMPPKQTAGAPGGIAAAAMPPSSAIPVATVSSYAWQKSATAHVAQAQQIGQVNPAMVHPMHAAPILALNSTAHTASKPLSAAPNTNAATTHTPTPNTVTSYSPSKPPSAAANASTVTGYASKAAESAKIQASSGRSHTDSGQLLSNQVPPAAERALTMDGSYMQAALEAKERAERERAHREALQAQAAAAKQAALARSKSVPKTATVGAVSPMAATSAKPTGQASAASKAPAPVNIGSYAATANKGTKPAGGIQHPPPSAPVSAVATPAAMQSAPLSAPVTPALSNTQHSGLLTPSSLPSTAQPSPSSALPAARAAWGTPTSSRAASAASAGFRSASAPKPRVPEVPRPRGTDKDAGKSSMAAQPGTGNQKAAVAGKHPGQQGMPATADPHAGNPLNTANAAGGVSSAQGGTSGGTKSRIPTPPKLHPASPNSHHAGLSGHHIHQLHNPLLGAVAPAVAEKQAPTKSITKEASYDSDFDFLERASDGDDEPDASSKPTIRRSQSGPMGSYASYSHQTNSHANGYSHSNIPAPNRDTSPLQKATHVQTTSHNSNNNASQKLQDARPAPLSIPRSGISTPGAKQSVPHSTTSQVSNTSLATRKHLSKFGTKPTTPFTQAIRELMGLPGSKPLQQSKFVGRLVDEGGKPTRLSEEEEKLLKSLQNIDAEILRRGLLAAGLLPDQATAVATAAAITGSNATATVAVPNSNAAAVAEATRKAGVGGAKGVPADKQAVAASVANSLQQQQLKESIEKLDDRLAALRQKMQLDTPGTPQRVPGTTANVTPADTTKQVMQKTPSTLAKPRNPTPNKAKAIRDTRQQELSSAQKNSAISSQQKQAATAATPAGSSPQKKPATAAATATATAAVQRQHPATANLPSPHTMITHTPSVIPPPTNPAALNNNGLWNAHAMHTQAQAAMQNFALPLHAQAPHVAAYVAHQPTPDVLNASFSFPQTLATAQLPRPTQHAPQQFPNQLTAAQPQQATIYQQSADHSSNIAFNSAILGSPSTMPIHTFSSAAAAPDSQLSGQPQQVAFVPTLLPNGQVAYVQQYVPVSQSHGQQAPTTMQSIPHQSSPSVPAHAHSTNANQPWTPSSIHPNWTQNIQMPGSAQPQSSMINPQMFAMLQASNGTFQPQQQQQGPPAAMLHAFQQQQQPYMSAPMPHALQQQPQQQSTSPSQLHPAIYSFQNSAAASLSQAGPTGHLPEPSNISVSNAAIPHYHSSVMRMRGHSLEGHNSPTASGSPVQRIPSSRAGHPVFGDQHGQGGNEKQGVAGGDAAGGLIKAYNLGVLLS